MSAHSFELTTLPGGHFFIHERQSDVVRALAGWLRAHGRASFLLTAACELYVLFYALWGCRTGGRTTSAATG